MSKIGENAYFIVEMTSFLVGVTPFDESLANQTIDYGWEEPLPIEIVEEPPKEKAKAS